MCNKINNKNGLSTITNDCCSVTTNRYNVVY